MVPGQVLLVPNYVLMTNLGLIDTMQAMILQVAINISFIFMMRQFFLSFPKDAEEVATIDGLSNTAVFFRIVMPMARPSIATQAVFIFMGFWNNFSNAIWYLKSPGNYTLTQGLQTLISSDGHSNFWNLGMAGSVITIIPIVIIYIIFNKHLLQGVRMDGKKYVLKKFNEIAKKTVCLMFPPNIRLQFFEGLLRIENKEVCQMTNFFWKEIMDQFTLTLSDLGNRGRGNIETLFAQANGFMGVRASLPVSDDKSTPGAFVNGFYETAPIIYGENAFGYAKNHEIMVKLFDFRSLELVIADEKLSKLIEQEIECDMKKGILSETYLYETASKKQLKIHLESFTSHANRSVYAQKISLTAVNFSGRVKIDKKAKHLKPEASENLDPRVRDASRELNFSGNKISTKNSNLSLYYQFDDFSQTVERLENESFELMQIYQLSKENKFQDVEYEALKNNKLKFLSNSGNNQTSS